MGSEMCIRDSNMTEGSLYIGETGDWAQRFKTHLKKTMMHSACVNPDVRCTGCTEHKKYMAQNTVQPFAWIMVGDLRE